MINVSLENTLQKKKSFLFFLSSIFIAEYGTSYVEEVSMGAKMVVETRFNKRANGVDETKQRMSCISVIHTFTLWSSSSQIPTYNLQQFLCNEFLTFFGNAGV